MIYKVFHLQDSMIYISCAQLMQQDAQIQYCEYRTMLLLGTEKRNALVKTRSTKCFDFTYLDGTYMGLNAVSSIN
jgi:hypothetical protein